MEASSSPQPINLSEARLKRFNLSDKLSKIVPFTKLQEQSQSLETRFDWQFYVEYYEDLGALTNYEEAYEHWIACGKLEGRVSNAASLERHFGLRKSELPEGFDHEQYLALNSDLQERFEKSQYRKYRAIEHYLEHGKPEGRYYNVLHVSQSLAQTIALHAANRKHVYFAAPNDDVYAQWLRENLPTAEDYRNMAKSVNRFDYKPFISVVMPTYNTPERFLREAIQAVLDQVYPYWELCIADDVSTQPHVKEILKEYAAKDARIKLIFRQINGHISACSNSALTLVTGEFVALLDHDDVLTPDALYQVAALLNQHPEADMIYSDEDKLNEQGYLLNPYFKPDWCPDSFLSRMYTCHLGVYRHSLIKKINGFRVGYEGSQDYDLVLRLTEYTNKIFHIPKVLYHWRIHAASTASGSAAKPYAYEAGVRAIVNALHRRGQVGRVISNEQFPGVYIVRYQITEPKLVSIIIPTRNLSQILDRCLESIFTKSTYPNYEVIVVDNGSDEPELKTLLSQWGQKEPVRFRYFDLDIPFNYSKLNNRAIAEAKGDYLLFLNNDTEVLTSDWIEAMVEQAQREEIGAVGGLLLYPNNSVQHAGILLGVCGVANHGHRHFSNHIPGYFSQLVTVNNYSSVTGACLMCRRDVFEQVGGFDEQLAVAFNDVDLCLKMVDQGYRNVYLPHVRLYHHESKSRGIDGISTEKMRRLQWESAIVQQRWQKYLEHDPCYSPNLTRTSENYELKFNHRISIEIADVALIQSSPALREFSIDDSEIGKVYQNFILLKGWVIGKAATAVSIEIVKDGRIIRRIPINVHRPDVAEHFSEIAEARYSGFQKKLGMFEFGSDVTDITLELLAVLSNQTRVHLGVLKFKITSS